LSRDQDDCDTVHTLVLVEGDNDRNESMIEIECGPVRDLRSHAAISCAFESRAVFDVMGEGGRNALVERTLDAPFRKDYDTVEDPLSWVEQFDVSNWVLVSARDGNRIVGGAIGARDTAGVDMLENRRDLLVLWDLRVAPEARGAGVGSALFRAVEDWGRRHSCVELKVETQNVNVRACHLYRAQGCALAQANRGAYPELPAEVQLIWRKWIGV
jgi:streptothricin acetyltransferase